MANLNDTPFQIILRQGTRANLNLAATTLTETLGEPLFTTDEFALYLFDGANNRPGVGQFPRTNIIAGYVALVSDYYIAVKNTAAPLVITLPSAVAVGANKAFIVKDETGGATVVNTITIQSVGGQTVDGAPNFVIAAGYGICRVVSDGANWFTW